jgi:hypothetical protein
MKPTHKTLSAACLALTALAGSGAVQAASCGANGVALSVVGTSTTADVTHNGADSDACVVSAVNPSQGTNGNASGFDGYGTFGTGWSLLVKHDVNGNYAGGSLFSNGVTFTSTIIGMPGTSGSWTLSSSQNVTLDLVFAMHGSNRSGAFLFNAEAVPGAGGNSWEINWLNNGGNVPDYSNLALFVRDVQVTPVPEPESYALMLAGLGVVGSIVRRRRVV